MNVLWECLSDMCYGVSKSREQVSVCEYGGGQHVTVCPLRFRWAVFIICSLDQKWKEINNNILLLSLSLQLCFRIFSLHILECHWQLELHLCYFSEIHVNIMNCVFCLSSCVAVTALTEWSGDERILSFSSWRLFVNHDSDSQVLWLLVLGVQTSSLLHLRRWEHWVDLVCKSHVTLDLNQNYCLTAAEKSLECGLRVTQDLNRILAMWFLTVVRQITCIQWVLLGSWERETALLYFQV